MRLPNLAVYPVSDGIFTAKPMYFGRDVPADAHPEVFSRRHTARLPIGCFVIRADRGIVLVDAGLGPESEELPFGMSLVGGHLLTRLRSLGVTAADVTDIVCSHLHADHVGWLFDLAGEPMFPRATVWFGAADWDHFVAGPGEMRSHIRSGFRQAADRGHARLISRDTSIVPGVDALLTPGHTPGHVCVSVASRKRRVLLLGDAITCPVQIEESAWHSFGDVDVTAADRTRERLWHELGDELTVGVGAHFPGLKVGRVRHDGRRRWSS